jgi:hypothetical protein
MALSFGALGAWTYLAAKPAWWKFSGDGSISVGYHTPAWLVSQGHLPALFGLCQPVGLALMASFIAIGALALRSSLVGFGAVCGYALAWHSLDACILTIQTSNTAVQTSGLHGFALAVAMSAVVAIGITIELAWMNHRLRVEHTAAARAAGETVETVSDVVAALAQSRLARFATNNQNGTDHSGPQYHTQEPRP